MDLDDAIAPLLTLYDDKLLAAVAGKLFRPRIGQPADELVERILETQKNPPVVDRLLKQLPATPQKLIALLGRSRQPRWRVDDLLALAVSLGDSDGFPIIATLLERGLLVAESGEPVSEFEAWFATLGSASVVMVPGSITVRAAALPFTLRNGDEISSSPAMSGTAAPVDGLDWPLRVALARQQVRIAAVKLTQTGALYKRDLTRFTGDTVLQSPLETGAAPADAGLLALSWARASSLLKFDGELTAADYPESWNKDLNETRADLFGALFAIGDWDPQAGSIPGTPTATASAGLLLVSLLADTPTHWLSLSTLAGWLWEHHPHWSGLISKDAAKANGTPWVEAWMQATMLPLGVVEMIPHSGEPHYRLTAFGVHLLAHGPAPVTAVAFPQTLLVQPNGEVLVYRQGLTPSLIARLTAFAGWKQIGAACTLELVAETMMRGLEDGLSLESILQTLERHGMKPTPPNVADLLRRWADKRERLVVYPSATLVEFLTEADLDAAIARGIVSVRLTNRIGLTGSGAAPDFQHLRLVGNRDYEAKPVACVVAEDDGITLRVDAAAADLLLDAEIARFAEPLPGTNGDARRYRMSPDSLRAAAEQGPSLEELEEWFMARSGESLPPAARLFLVPASRSSLTASNLLVVEAPTSDIADGIEQWPTTAGYVIRRLGPTAFAVDRSEIAALQERLSSIGIRIEIAG